MVVGGFVRAATAASAGVVISLAFDPFGFWLAAPLAVAIATGLFAEPSAKPWRTLGHGYLVGVGFFGVHLWWLTASIGFTAWLLVVVAEATWFCATALLVRWGAGSRLRVLVWGLAWVAPEILRGRVPFGGFPWGRLGFSVIDSPWAAALPYLGITGVSLLIALVGSSFAWVVLEGRTVAVRRVSVPAAVVLVSLIPAVLPYAPVVTGSTSVAVIQSGVPGDGTQVAPYGPRIVRETADATVDLAAAIARGERPPVDLVVWAENSTSTDPFVDGETRGQIDRAVAATGRPLLVGALVDGPTPQALFNRTVVWLPSGPAAGTGYTKAHPVPFGEYIPLRGLLSGVSSQLNAVPRDALPGRNPVPLAVAGVRLAMAICFDIAFDEPLRQQVRDGSDLIVVQTSNATFTGTTQPDQQFAISRARALEAGRSVVVASLNGRSGVISPQGIVQAELPMEETATAVVDVETSDSLTPAVRFGEWLDRGALGFAGLSVLLLLLRGARATPRR